MCVRASSAICCKVTCGEPPVLAHASLLEPEPNVTAGTAGGLRKKGPRANYSKGCSDFRNCLKTIQNNSKHLKDTYFTCVILFPGCVDMLTPELENFYPYHVSLKRSKKPIYTCHVWFYARERTLLLVACDIRQKLQEWCKAACESKSTFPAASSCFFNVFWLSVCNRIVVALLFSTVVQTDLTCGGCQVHGIQTVVTVTLLHLQWLYPSVLATIFFFYIV